MLEGVRPTDIDTCTSSRARDDDATAKRYVCGVGVYLVSLIATGRNLSDVADDDDDDDRVTNSGDVLVRGAKWVRVNYRFVPTCRE